RDLLTHTTTLLSARDPGLPALTGFGPSSQTPSVSADGRFVAFLSNNPDLVTNPATTSFQDVYVRDLQNQTTTMVSVNRDGTGGANGTAEFPLISGNGRFELWVSAATDLVPNPVSGHNQQVYERDLQTGTTQLVSVALDGGEGNQPSADNPNLSQIAVSADGRFVVFESEATNLVANDATGTQQSFDRQLFVRDMVAGIT